MLTEIKNYISLEMRLLVIFIKRFRKANAMKISEFFVFIIASYVQAESIFLQDGC
jgi:hypothetical protein